MPRIPTIHRNGTDAMALREACAEVGHAILDLARKMEAAEPNARDYYPQGEGAYEHARNEHAAQLARLDGIRIYYLEMLQGIQDQIDSRDTKPFRKVTP